MARSFASIFSALAIAVGPARAADEPVRWDCGHPIACVAVSPDGKTLVVGGAAKKGESTDIYRRGKWTLLDVATGKIVRSVETERSVLAIAISPDGKRLLVGELDRGLPIPADRKGSAFPRLWDLATGKSLMELDGHTDLIGGAAFFPDGKRVVTSSGDGTVRVWDAATGKELLLVKTSTLNGAVTVSPDGKWFAVGGGATRLTVWDAESGKAALEANVGYSTNNVAFSPDGSLVAVCSTGVNDIALLDGKTGEKKGTIVVGFDREKKLAIADNVTSNLLFSPDGKWLVTGNGEPTREDRPGELTLWDVVGRKKRSGHAGHPAPIRWLTFTPDGKSLVSTSSDGTVLMWDFAKLAKAAKEE